MRLYLIALQFLTIIPLPFLRPPEERELGRSMALFPMVGLTLGAGLAGSDYLLSPWLPRPVVDLISIALLSALTGGLHLDGLADVCDGLAARGDRERFLAVMKDPRIGAIGVTGLLLGLLLKYQALLHLPAAYKMHSLLFFPMAARFSQVQMTTGAKRARSDGLGSLFIGGAGTWQLIVSGVVTLAVAWLLFGIRGIWALLSVILLTWGMKLWFHRRVGGINGDIIGCASELSEILTLLALIALFR